MNTTIPNNGLPKFTQPTNSFGNGSATATTVAGSTATTPKAGDQVKLTDSARALQAAARAKDTTAPVDAPRVERVRQALADGSYKISPGNIADRMLALEQQIGGPGKA
jgi:negative regulator of flagellin synthesis FlgM